MRDTVKEAIQAAYVDSQGHADPNYRLISKQRAEIIAQEIRTRCDANVTLSDDTNYSHSYHLEIVTSDLFTPAQLVLNPSLEARLPARHYVLLMRISWLGPFALKYWTRYEQGKIPPYLLKPETPRDKDLEACVVDLLHHHGIEILSEEELEEAVPFVKITLVDDAAVNVRHLLFFELM